MDEITYNNSGVLFTGFMKILQIIDPRSGKILEYIQ
jgi:hypothetical protein